MFGPILELKIGGEHVWLDCPDGGNQQGGDDGCCPTFDDLLVGATYAVGETIVTSGFTLAVEEFYNDAGCTSPSSDGLAIVGAGGKTDCAGQDLWTNNVNIAFQCGWPVDGLSICFAWNGGIVNLTVNGECFFGVEGTEIPPPGSESCGDDPREDPLPDCASRQCP